MLLWWLRYGRKIAIAPQKNNSKPKTKIPINQHTKKDMKLNTTLILAAASLSIGSLQAATVIWTGADNNVFNQVNNWSEGGVPGVGTGAVDLVNDLFVISNGDTVSGTSPSFNMNLKSGLTINGGSTLSLTASNWTKILNGSTMTVDNGTYVRDSGNRLEIDGSSLVAKNNAVITGTFATSTNTTGLLNVKVSSTVTISGDSVFTFDYYQIDSTSVVNFTGAGTMVGSLNAVGGTTTWESYYALGRLKFDNANPVGLFSDNFSTTGTVGTVGYTLTAVPEPSSTALLGLGGLALILRRCK